MEQQKVYYFDNNATTRVAPEVVDAMIPFLREFWGNPMGFLWDFIGTPMGFIWDFCRIPIGISIGFL